MANPSSQSRTPKTSGSSAPDVKVDETKVKKKPTASWVNSIYDQANISAEELLQMYDLLRYQGFDRDEMLAELEKKASNPRLAAEIIMVCSLRGPKQAVRAKLSNGKTPHEMGIPASDQKGTRNLSCQRISAATADLAAAFLKRLDVPKRIISSPLPGWLQFPTAGSIKLPDNLRTLHIEFSRQFSKLIGGEFNEQIYAAMMNSAYLDDRLNLF